MTVKVPSHAEFPGILEGLKGERGSEIIYEEIIWTVKQDTAIFLFPGPHK